MKIVVCCIILCGIVFAAEYFPITAMLVDDTLWFNGAGEDSLGLNLLWVGGPRSDVFKQKALRVARSEGLQCMLWNVVRGTQGGSFNSNELEWYSRLYWTNWEVDSSNFSQYIGARVTDSIAQNHDAWKATVGVDDPATIIEGPDRRAKTRSNTTYDVYFLLKVETLGDTSTKVCSLWVKDGSTLKVQKVVKVADFSAAEIYDTIPLSYFNDWCGQIHYGIYWYGNRTLWADYIETKDRYIESVLRGDSTETLLSILGRYNDSLALDYFYLLDEPDVGQLAANAYLMRFLRENHRKPGIQITWRWDAGTYQAYADSVTPNIFVIDYYPLLGDSSGNPTPVESGEEFQARIDAMCEAISEARSLVKQVQPNEIPFWFWCQAFGQYVPSGGTAYQREPTPRELKCMVWLALAHGAKGIGYFNYTCPPENYWIDSGLTVPPSGTPRYPIWTAAKEMNFVMRTIGPRLLDMTSDTVFKYPHSVIPPRCFLDYISNDDTVQVGTFHVDSDSFFIIANRLCQASDSDTMVVRIKKDSIFLYDLYTGEAIPPDSEYNNKAVFSFKLPPAQGRCFQVVPFAQDFKLNNNALYSNMRFVALTTKAWAQESIDSMKISQTYHLAPDTLTEYEYSTGWIPYDTAYCWYLRQWAQRSNKVSIQYKVDGSIVTPPFFDEIVFDSTAPIGSFVINDDSTFTNASAVTMANSLTDARSGLAQMRFGNKDLENLIVNSDFDSSGAWEYDSAVYYDTLGLYEIPISSAGAYFYQVISAESLTAFDNDTLLLWIDLVSNDFAGVGKVKFMYIYGLPTDTINPRAQQPCADSIFIPQGTNAQVAQYNLATFFIYHPTPPPGKFLLEARVGVYVDAGAGNTGSLFIDNLRLDVVSPYRDYSKFVPYDATEDWMLDSGNGVRKVYGQFADGAGNETTVLWDSIIADTTKPEAAISSPDKDQVLSGNVGITGYAFDCADPVQHFKEYSLYYQDLESQEEEWYGVHPDSIFDDPVNPTIPPQDLAKWETKQVTEYHGDGWYYLRLTVSDSASNCRGDTVLVYIRNDREEKGEIAGFSNDVYGLAAEDEIFIGELGTGKIYRYDNIYQLLDTFALVDSIGIGLPLAMALDDSGKLWVTNIISHYVNRFTSQGNLLLQFAGGFSLPSGIALDETCNEWVSDRLHHKIKKFDDQGNLLFQFGTRGSDPGEIDRPIGVAYSNGEIYIADSRNRRISIFDTLGNFVRIIGDSAWLVMPFGIVVDTTGCAFVSDAVGNQVVEFGPSGNRLFGIDSILDSPTGLALSSDARTLYISDSRNRRVLAYAVREEPPLGGGGPQAMGEVDISTLTFDIFPCPFSSRLTIKLQGMAGNRLTLKFYDVTGRLIKTFFDNDLVKYDQNIIWDGQDDQQRKCAAGVYFLRLEIGDYSDTKKTILTK